MSQSTTTAGSRNCSQNDTYDQALQLNYPDRQDFAYSSQESFTVCSPNVLLTQISNQPSYSQQSASVCCDSIQSISATPTPTDSKAEEEDNLRRAIAKMNADMTKHGYKAFVHENTHIMFRSYGFNLNMK